jgi:diguanylate cyclase (GGDEF)-like protein
VSISSQDQAFNLEQPAASREPASTESATQVFDTKDIERSVNAAGIAAYCWDITNDELTWSDNAAELLERNTADLNTGKRFSTFLDTDNLTSRFDAVMNSKGRDNGRGVQFHIEYQFKPEGRSGIRSIWLEDVGSWHADSDGRPQRVYGTVRRVDQRHLQEQNLNFMGSTDPITGTINRARMTDLLAEAIANSLREHSSCGFAIASIANLGVINEAYGFEIADEVISQIARRLKQVMRSGDVIARYSGSKFGFVLNNCTPNDLEKAGERLLAIVRDNVIETSKGPVWAILSLGAISIPESTQDTAAAIAFAEEALNEARARPADACVIYTHSEARHIRQTLNARCANEIVSCLKEGSFKLAYQPVVDAKTGKVHMHEALLRMIDQTGEIIPAGHLIPIAEHIGLIRLIDRCVVQMAVTALHSYPEARISLNISYNSATDSRWNKQLLDLLSADRSIASRITVEVTESVAFSELEAPREFIAELQTLGCRVAVDDFGAGYTSFRNVRGLNIDMIKLDGTFCRNLKESAEARFYAKCLIDLGKQFNMKTIAEWVESPEDADVLRELGIDYLQGHFLGQVSIEAPWQTKTSPSFAITDAPPAEAWDDPMVETAPIAVDVEVSSASEPVVEQTIDPSAEPKPEPTFEPVMDYSFDDGLAKLRATLALLDSTPAEAA